MAKRKRKRNVIGIILLLIQVIAAAVFVVLLSHLDVLPGRYVIIIAAILMGLCIIALIMNISASGKTVGAVYSAVIAVILIFGSVYLWKTNATLDEVSTQENHYVTSQISILVKADRGMEGLQDLQGEKIGTQQMLDQAKMKQSLTELQMYFEEELGTVEYISYISAVDGLYSGEVGAILFNEAFRDMVKDSYPGFDTETVVLTEYKYKEITKTTEDEKNDTSAINKAEKDIRQDTFIVYLSGNDSYGEVYIDGGRSDVNILMVVNPESKQILLITTPRDSYVWLPRFQANDKLTHSGIYGIDVPMETLEYLYDIEIDYYARINFSGFEDIIDALGGVTVYCDEDFSTFDGRYFEEGYVDLDGSEALSFVRERHNVSGGDLGRGRHQMAVIDAMIEKATSPAILKNYLSLMDSISGAFITNMPKDKISDLVKMQLDDNASWTITRYEVDGAGNMRTTCYSSWGFEASVIDLYDDSVEEAIYLIQKIQNGESLDDYD